MYSPPPIGDLVQETPSRAFFFFFAPSRTLDKGGVLYVYRPKQGDGKATCCKGNLFPGIPFVRALTPAVSASRPVMVNKVEDEEADTESYRPAKRKDAAEL